jgi:hypothetical protein
MEETTATRAPAPAQHPPRRARRVPWPTISMVPAGVFGIWVGSADAVTATSLLSRLFGASLVLVGVLLLVGFLAMVLDLQWQRELALLACIAGASSALALVAIQVVGYDINYRLLLWSAAALVLVGGAVQLVRSGARTAPLTKLGAILSAGTIIGLAQLFYGSSLPTAQAPSVSITATLSKAGSRVPDGVDAGTLALDTMISVRNVGNSRVQLLGSTYLLVGVRSDREAGPVDDAGWRARVQRAFEGNIEASRLVKNKRQQVLASGVIYGPGYTLSSNEEDVYETTIYAPSEGFDSVFLKVKIATAGADRMRLSDDPIDTNVVDDPDHPTVIWDEYRIHEASLANRLTREARYLHTGWELSGDTGNLFPDLVVYVDAESRREEAYSDYNERLAQVYGIDYSSVITELSLWR